MQEMRKMLEEIRKEMKQGFKKADENNSELNSTFNKVMNTMNSVVDRVQELEVAWVGMDDKVRLLEEKVDYLENQSRRNNIVLYGVGEEERESWEMTSDIVRHVIAQTGISLIENDIERAHRVGSSRGPRPIVCKLAHYKTKGKVLREARWLKGTGVSIGEDFSVRVREERAFLKKHLVMAKKQGAHAFLRFDKLVVNGRVRSHKKLLEIERCENDCAPRGNSPPRQVTVTTSTGAGRKDSPVKRTDHMPVEKTTPEVNNSDGVLLRSRMSERLANTMKRQQRT